MVSLGLIEAIGPTVNILVRAPDGTLAASPRWAIGKDAGDDTWALVILVGVALGCCVVNMVEFE